MEKQNSGMPALEWGGRFVKMMLCVYGVAMVALALNGCDGAEGVESVSLWVGVLRVKTPGYKLPDPITYAVWTEPLCGMPAQAPPWQAVPLAACDQVMLDGVGVGLSCPLAAVVGLAPQGFPESGFSALRLTQPNMGPAAFEPMVGDGDPTRALWFGLVDADGDGVTDAELGWATLAAPTAPGVEAAAFDLGLGAQ